MTKRRFTTSVRMLVALTALLLAVAGCGGSTGGKSGNQSGGAADKKINFGQIQGWTDETATAALLGVILKDHGYTVKYTDVSDNAPMYTGLAKGDIDVLSSSWLERTHKDYWKRFGKDIADLGTYYDDAQNFLAVPDYSDMKSIDDVAAHAAELGKQITGIEPGAGLTKTTQNSVMPAYGLTDFKLVTSSTAAMLTQLKKKIQAKEPIVVTLWRPFWANQAFPVRALEDPKNAFGGSEKLHVVANKKYAADHPEVANMLANFKLTDEQYGSLENMVVNDFGQGKEEEAAKAWLAKNPGYADALAAHRTKQ